MSAVQVQAAPQVPARHTLPASWWTSEKIFEIEKRSIFFKSWLYCTHSCRFKKAGDYFQFTIAGLSFFIILSKDGTYNAFHNVCRHRAYPVVKKELGSSTVLGCRYHGWSYDTNGKLTKAPQFDEVEGFVKEENSLFPIKTHVTPQGLIFINFNNDNSDKFLGFEQFFEGLTTELSEFDFSDYEYHMSYELDGQFNWKTLMDGYQECYHCPTAHPGLSSAFRMETYKVVPKTRYCRHYADIYKPEELKKKLDGHNPGGQNDGLWVYLFPTNGVNCYSPAWYTIRVLPISPSHTILQYDIYTKKGLDEASKKEFVDFLQEVELEDFNLCELTQKNLNQGVYSTGYLHPTKEQGVLYYQGLVRDMVKEHLAYEEKHGVTNPALIAGHQSKEAEELDKLCGGGCEADW